MSNAEIIQEKPITLVNLRSKLDKVGKKEDELNFRAVKVQEYLKKFAKFDVKKSEEMYKKIEELEIPRLKDRQIVKIIDLMPEDIEDLKTIFSGEITTITPENLEKIMSVVKEYVK